MEELRQLKIARASEGLLVSGVRGFGRHCFEEDVWFPKYSNQLALGDWGDVVMAGMIAKTKTPIC